MVDFLQKLYGDFPLARRQGAQLLMNMLNIPRLLLRPASRKPRLAAAVQHQYIRLPLVCFFQAVCILDFVSGHMRRSPLPASLNFHHAIALPICSSSVQSLSCDSCEAASYGSSHPRVRERKLSALRSRYLISTSVLMSCASCISYLKRRQ